jgi:hypothetical protein
MTNMQMAWGDEVTKTFVHHKHKSDTLNLAYSDRNARLDVVGAVAGNGRQTRINSNKPNRAPALFRPVQAFVPPSRLTSDEARKISDDLDWLIELREDIELARQKEEWNWESFLVSDSSLFAL